MAATPHPRRAASRRGLQRGIFGGMLTLAALASLACAPPQPPLEPVDRPWPEVDEVVLSAFDEGRVVGAAVVIIEDGAIRYARGYGWAGWRRPVEVERTLFRAGSLSKTLTALAAVAASEAGLLDLDANIDPLVDAWEAPSVLARPGEAPVDMGGPVIITARQLLGHLGGLTRMKEMGAAGLPTRRQLRRHRGERGFTWAFSRWADEPLRALPGEGYSYSSYGVNVVGAALEQVTGWDLDTFLHDAALTPLGVDVDGVRPERWWQDIPERSQPYSYLKGGIVEHDGVDYASASLPGSGFLVTAYALGQLCEALVSGRAPEAWTQALWTSQRDHSGASIGYGLGTRVTELEDGRALVGHVGGIVGGSGRVLALPEEGSCVVLLTNTRHSDAPELAMELIEALF